MATQQQIIKFFKVWGKAKQSVCEEMKLDPDNREAVELARHMWIEKHTGHPSLKVCKPVGQYDRLMLATAIAADDYELAAHYSIADENRIRYLTEQCLRQIGELQGLELPWNYVRGMYKHIGWPADWKDIPAKELFDVFKMLDTHRRRILRNAHGQREDVKFAPDQSYNGCAPVQPGGFQTSDSSRKELVCSR